MRSRFFNNASPEMLAELRRQAAGLHAAGYTTTAPPPLRDAPGRRGPGGYTPTLGMLRALVDAPGATPLDYDRCRLRGLVDHQLMPTPAGRAAIQAETARLRELRRG